MSSSQTLASKGKNASSVGTKAQWDQRSKECFIRACVEELGGAAYKAGTQLTKLGWANVVKKFNEQTGKMYDKIQLKNQWAVLKKDWQLWQNLVLNESGLGRDPETGAITASDECGIPNVPSFGRSPCHWRKKCAFFSQATQLLGSIGTPQSSGLLPGVRNTPPVDCDNIDELLEDDDEIQELVHPTESQKKRRAETSSGKKGKGKKGSATSRLEACLQQICDTDSASSPSIQRVVEAPTLKECADALNELPEFKDDYELWARGYNVFQSPKQRAMFMSCDHPMKKYYWLTHEMNRVQRAELGNSSWFAPPSSNPGGL
ncbi:hypothetical protein Vadar_032659 [Vaccinium darrowii]|uniref:Uncharacterized protein n=1 Tax=Vaccinium darrowii TaxID=229202 RepID=A0ACB7X608_9ERIC|nr:hypothetical protein Vadar_032659 [Vaccinium darrowii]